jgi:alkylation response protein AidB-like acyl-CoA dehydrogenase
MAPVLDYFLVTAWIEEKETMGEFLVPRETAGVIIEETWDVISMRGTASHDLVLTEVLIPEENLVEVITPRKKEVNPWLLHIPACYAGIAQAARNEAVAFASTYQPNSLPGPIKEVPNIQRLIGEIELSLLQARHLLYSIASRAEDEEQRPHIGPELGAVKLTVTNHAVTIVDRAMRVVGAKSLQLSHPLQRHYRDVRSGLHNPPMDDTVIQQLAQRSFAQSAE